MKCENEKEEKDEYLFKIYVDPFGEPVGRRSCRIFDRCDEPSGAWKRRGGTSGAVKRSHASYSYSSDFAECDFRRDYPEKERVHWETSGDAEDEEGDALEYELEQIGAIGLVGNNILTVLSLIILSTGYSLEYMESLSAVGNKWLLASFVVFILGNSYAGIWQVRLIKETQKIYPERAADPTSGKFQEQWLKSCDEAEREIIYQSSYKAYLAMMKVIPILTFAALLTHLLWNTGVLAVVFLGIAWIFTTLTYSRNCVVLKGKKLNT